MDALGRQWPPSELRTGDADREAVVAELQRHYVDGRLTDEELGERVAHALSARTFGQLALPLADLPVLEPVGRTLAEQATPGLAQPWFAASHLLGLTLVTMGIVMLLATVVFHTLHLGGLPFWPLMFFGFFLFGRPHRGGRA